MHCLDMQLSKSAIVSHLPPCPALSTNVNLPLKIDHSPYLAFFLPRNETHNSSTYVFRLWKCPPVLPGKSADSKQNQIFSAQQASYLSKYPLSARSGPCTGAAGAFWNSEVHSTAIIPSSRSVNAVFGIVVKSPSPCYFSSQ